MIRCLLLAVVLGGLYARAAAKEPFYTFDLSHLNKLDLHDDANARTAWDTAHLVTSVQGIVNRNSPNLFVRFMPHPDDFWFGYLQNERDWPKGREAMALSSLEELLATFEPHLRGVVVYDDRVPATSNLASTIAGVEDRVCLRYDPSPDSVYTRVLAMPHRFVGDVLRLINDDGTPLFTGTGTIPGTDITSTGSAKCDAYLWANRHYLSKGRCSVGYMAFYIDAYWLQHPAISGFTNATLTNHDFFISQRAFFFDLHVWDEETPVDDRSQPSGSDAATLKTLLRTRYDQGRGSIVYIGGFTPWLWKYTDHTIAGGAHGGVDTEWRYAQIISAYNGIMDADALGYSGMANASFYQHFPLKKRYPQNPKPTLNDLRERGLVSKHGRVAPKGYVCFYMGDYDSAAWLNLHVPRWWADPAHGAVVCPWAFNPNLDRRAPHVMDYARTHQSPKDWFIFGDSGAGYLNPGMLVEPRAESGLPNGLDAWVAFNRPFAKRYDLSITGFIIDGHSPGMGDAGMDAYLRFSPDGIVGQKIPSQGLHRNQMPFIRMAMDLHGDPKTAGAHIADLIGVNVPKFLFIRTILKSPSWHHATVEAATEANPDLEFCDPYTFFLLLKQHERTRARVGDAAPSPASVRFLPPRTADGLAPISVADGPFTRQVHQGEPVIHQPAADRVQYLYFETSDAFARQFRAVGADTPRAVVTVTVFDAAPGRLGIHYDAGLDDAYRAGPEVRLHGTQAWMKVCFELPEPRFGKGQNGGADFRLVNFGADLWVREIEVTRADPGE